MATVKKVKVGMPITMAGIVGLSPDEKLSNVEIDPKLFMGLVVALLVIAKIFHVIVG